jgi:hypothetical protein
MPENRESKIIEKVIQMSVQESILFFDNVSIIDFPYETKELVNILGISTVLNLMIITPRIYIKKNGIDKFKINNNYETGMILSNLPKEVKTTLIKRYGGENIELPTIDNVKKRTLFRVYKNQCLELLKEGKTASDIFRLIPLSKYSIMRFLKGKK